VIDSRVKHRESVRVFLAVTEGHLWMILSGPPALNIWQTRHRLPGNSVRKSSIDPGVSDSSEHDYQNTPSESHAHTHTGLFAI